MSGLCSLPCLLLALKAQWQVPETGHGPHRRNFAADVDVVFIRLSEAPDVENISSRGPIGGFTTGNCLIILDSGAAVDVCCDRTYLIPGTERPCKRQIAGVGGVHTVTCEADFRFPIRTDDGGIAQLRRSALLVPECPHHLLSACNAAAEGVFSVHVGLGTEPSFLSLRDGRRAPLINSGVLVLPDKNVQLAMSLLPKATEGGAEHGLDVDGDILHYRFGHRNARALQHLPSATRDAPAPKWPRRGYRQ
eukprot:scaffold501_cov105-Isochrysis_galbana.AAC.5